MRQLDAVAARLLPALAGQAPILPDAGQVCYVDLDDTVKATHGYPKQGAGYGYSGVKGLNALIATVCTPTSPPLIVATRLRRGGTNSARGAARIVADAMATTRACGGSGLVILCADSAYYGRDVIAAARRGGAKFSITARMDPASGDLEHPGLDLGGDPLPERDLGPGAAAVHLRRAGHRGPEHPRSPPAVSPSR